MGTPLGTPLGTLTRRAQQREHNNLSEQKNRPVGHASRRRHVTARLGSWIIEFDVDPHLLPTANSHFCTRPTTPIHARRRGAAGSAPGSSSSTWAHTFCPRPTATHTSRHTHRPEIAFRRISMAQDTRSSSQAARRGRLGSWLIELDVDPLDVTVRLPEIGARLCTTVTRAVTRAVIRAVTRAVTRAATRAVIRASRYPSRYTSEPSPELYRYPSLQPHPRIPAAFSTGWVDSCVPGGLTHMYRVDSCVRGG